MYDADYEDFKREQTQQEYALREHAYEVRDSGKKAVYSDGNQRDSTEGKPRFDLLYPRGMPYEETLLYRTAMHYMRGGKTYGDRNWEKSSTEESLLAHEQALHRHFTKFALHIEDGEDHAAAIVWNIQAILYTRWRLKQRVEAEVPAVNSDNTAEPTRVEGGLSPWQTYVFPVAAAAGSSGHPYFNEVKIKAPNLTAAKRELEKMLGRETAEHSAELDAQDDPQMASGQQVAEMTGPQWKMDEKPCIDCKQQTCEYGEGRCRACQEKNTTARWQKNAAQIGGPCPDGGACHHGCVEQQDWPCYRVLTCGPLSGVMPGDRWPPEVVQHNNDKEASRLLLEAERNRQA